MDRLKALLRRIISRARTSPNPAVRRALESARSTYRGVGWLVPALHLGWMSSLRAVWWDGDDLVLRGWSLVRGTDHGGSPRHEVFLRRRFVPTWLGGRGPRAAARHVPNRDVLGGPGRGELDYLGGTWEARFAAADLATLARGRWQLRAKISGGRRRSWGRVKGVYLLGTPVTTGLRTFGDRLVGPVAEAGRGAFIVSVPVGLPVLDASTTGRDITLAVSVDVAARAGSVLLRGAGQPDVPLSPRLEGERVLFTGTVPAGKSILDKAQGVLRPPTWSALAAETGQPLVLLADHDVRHPPLVLRPGADRRLEVVDVPHLVEVDSAKREGDQLLLTGTVLGDPTTFSLVLSAARAEIPVTLDSIDGHGRFTASAPLWVSTWGGPVLPLMRGAYVLEGRLNDVDGASAVFTTFVSETLQRSIPMVESDPDIRFRLELNRQPQLLIRVTRPRADDEYGAFNQRKLFQQYAMGETEPLDAVYFESFFGRSATCNPRAIDAEVARRHPDLPRYWSVDDRSVAVPDGAIPLVLGTREWWRVRESARWIVTNEWLRGKYAKKSFQTVLQTWHGSMYKRIGMDRGGSGHIDRARVERANWDMFISQNADTTPIIQQAYAFEGDEAKGVLEIGYPRNGELLSVDPERVAEIRRRVGISEGSRVVMYAPTWREANQKVQLLNLASLARKLPDAGFTFLQRGHVRTLDETAAVHSDSVIDVSTYPQINELYLITDLLITDYSSMMFDYSVMRRPMLFYTPDIAEYTDPKVRGAYFDLAEIAPGPVVETVPEVVDLLSTFDAWASTYADRYAAWHQRFNHLDDGHAAERAVDALFAFDPSQRDGTAQRREYDPTAGEED